MYNATYQMRDELHERTPIIFFYVFVVIKWRYLSSGGAKTLRQSSSVTKGVTVDVKRH